MPNACAVLRSLAANNMSNLLNAHRFQCLFDSVHHIAHLIRIDCPNASNSERFDLSQFAGIQNVAAVARHFVERVEVVRRIGRRVKRDDDRRLHGR